MVEVTEGFTEGRCDGIPKSELDSVAEEGGKECSWRKHRHADSVVLWVIENLGWDMKEDETNGNILQRAQWLLSQTDRLAGSSFSLASPEDEMAAQSHREWNWKLCLLLKAV